MASRLEHVAVTPQKKDPAWKHCQMYKNGDKIQLKCLYCGKMFKGGGIHRIKEHLACQKGNASCCLRVLPDVRVLMQESLNGVVARKKKKQKLADEITGFNTSDEVDNLTNSCGLDDNVELLPVPDTIEQGSSFLVNQEEGSSKRGGGQRKKRRVRKVAVSAAPNDVIVPYNNNEVGVKGENHQVQMAIGRFLFDIGVPLDAVNSKYFQPMIDAIASQGEGVMGPSYHDLRSWILKNSVQEVKNDIDQWMETWGKSGCSVLVDEWTLDLGRKLINFSVYCPEGVMFLRSVDITDIFSSVDALYELVKEVVEEVGVRNVLQLVTNCEEHYVVVGKRLADTFPTLFWTPCAAQCIDLMLEDFRQLEWIKTILEQARSISRFIYNNVFVLNMMKRYTYGVDLVEVGPTRSSTDFATLKRMVDIKHNLHSMVISEEWVDCEYSKKPEGYTMTEYVGNQSFWSMCTLITRFMDPLLRLSRLVSGEKRPGMGYVYAGIYRAKETIKKELVNKKDYMVYWNIIDHRWEHLHRHPLHAAGFYLNPKFFYSTDGDIHLQIRSLVYDCVERLVPDPKIQDKIVTETSSYRGAVGDFGRKMAIRARETLPPADWWSTYGGACPNLARLAMRILSQTCSLIGFKTKRIPLQHVHETKNSIEHQRLTELVYVQYNLRLKQMYLKNKEHYLLDPVSYENINVVEDWVTEKETSSDDVGSSDWMSVVPPLANTTLLGPPDDDVEALGAGFNDHEIFNGVKDEDENENENGEDNVLNL